MPTRIAAAFIVSGDHLISRIHYHTFAGNNSYISNVDNVTVCHLSSDFRETHYAARKITETSFTPLIQYLAHVNTDAHIKSVVRSIDIKSARAKFNILSVTARSFACGAFWISYQLISVLGLHDEIIINCNIKTFMRDNLLCFGCKVFINEIVAKTC